MPRLNVVKPEDATGPVKEIYEDLTKKMGKVINIFQGMGNSPAALKAYLSMSGALNHGELSPEDREVVYLGVSQRNHCQYCVSAHTLLAKKAGLNDEEILSIRRFAPQSEQHQALLKFVTRVIETQGFVEDSEVAAVREAGYSDGQIAEAIAYIGLATYSNLFNHVYGTELDFPPAPERVIAPRSPVVSNHVLRRIKTHENSLSLLKMAGLGVGRVDGVGCRPAAGNPNPMPGKHPQPRRVKRRFR